MPPFMVKEPPSSPEEPNERSPRPPMAAPEPAVHQTRSAPGSSLSITVRGSPFVMRVPLARTVSAGTKPSSGTIALPFWSLLATESSIVREAPVGLWMPEPFAAKETSELCVPSARTRWQVAPLAMSMALLVSMVDSARIPTPASVICASRPAGMRRRVLVGLVCAPTMVCTFSSSLSERAWSLVRKAKCLSVFTVRVLAVSS